MKTKTIISIVAAVSAVMITSCKTQDKLAVNYTYESECLGIDLDGSQTLKVWGTGRTREEAIEQAKKNGVRDVLFKGIRKGKPDCDLRPVLAGVNVQEKNESYFNTFFAHNGAYKDFISIRKDYIGKTNEVEFASSSKNNKLYSVIIMVQRAQIKERMIQDRILTP